MKVVYVVAYIESEAGWGQKPMGYVLYSDKSKCITNTKQASKDGPNADGTYYYGPVRPLTFVEVPFQSLTAQQKRTLKDKGTTIADHNWVPSFSGNKQDIL